MTPNEIFKLNPNKNYLSYGGEKINAKKESLLKEIAETNIPDSTIDLIKNVIEQYKK